MAERASATCEVLIDGQPIACTREALFAGAPTILDPLTMTWGRPGAWDQPDAGSASFRLRDQRTNPQPIVDTIHVGSKVDVFAEAPNPDPQPQVVMNQGFESAGTSGGELLDSWWALETLPSALKRTNLATDPSFTTTSGKTAGGSATLAISNAWAQFGSTSLSITPNGSSNLSAVFPLGGSGMTAFETGKTYTVSVYIRLTAAQIGTLNTDARRIRLHQATGGATTIVARSAPAPNAAGVYRLSLTFTVAVDVTQCIISVCNGSSFAADVMWVDGLLIQEGSALDVYFDGTTARPGYTYAWTGTANASTSTERYNATSTNATVRIYDTGSGFPVGQGSRSALLDNDNTRARYLFPPAQWGRPWMRNLRPLQPNEVWTYSFMARLPAGTTASFSTRGFSASTVDGQTINMTVDGALARTITGTGNWETYTGTVRNASIPALPRWPVFALTVFPESRDFAGGMPDVDAITYTAPPLATERVQVWAGRVTDLTVVKATGRGAIELDVTATGEIAEVENVVVGDEPWPSETSDARIDRIIDLIPLPVTDFSVSRDLLNWELVIPRDVDAQPALGLLRDYASMVLGAVWPISVPGARNHAWIENTLNRWSGWSGPVGQLSACNMDASKIAITQAADQVITVAAVTWQQIQPDSSFIERTESRVDLVASAIYGARNLNLATEFSSLPAAQRTGDHVLQSARASDWGLSGVEFDTKHVDNTDGNAQRLLMLLLNSARRPGSWLTITDLPEWMPVELASGFVEGGTITYTGGRWRFDLNMSSGNPNGGS
ncbi:hypothetical protein [Microlunatus parietis]|uniref:Uncharacterized protein n=1 Tax=Microlunatus parietis TaxID=682979 RepID=A0A7Y9I268_9ACTN|nr:hypothetical protein [Microlunatus parietis]NYE68859.1 hypothetical protein [Microlunatus parietis]